jgi:hypothetical protein
MGGMGGVGGARDTLQKKKGEKNNSQPHSNIKCPSSRSTPMNTRYMGRNTHSANTGCGCVRAHSHVNTATQQNFPWLVWDCPHRFKGLYVRLHPRTYRMNTTSRVSM